MTKPLVSWFIVFACLLHSGYALASMDSRLKTLAKENASVVKKANKIKDDALRESVVGLANNIFLMEKIDISNESTPRASTYAWPEEMLLKHYDSPQTLANNYIAGLLGEQNLNKDSEVKLQRPFDYPFREETTITSITFEDGTTTPTKARIDYSADLLQTTHVDTEVYVRYPRGKEQSAIRGTADIEIDIPQAIDRVSFSKGDTGQPRSTEHFSIKRLNIERHFVELEISFNQTQTKRPNNNNIVVHAKDTTGRYLDSKGSSSARPGEIEKLKELLKKSIKSTPSKTDFDQYIKQALSKDSSERTYYRKFYFRGLIDTLDIYLIDDRKVITQKEAVEFPIYTNVYDESILTLKKIPTLATAYDHRTHHLLHINKTELNSYEFDHAIEKTYSRSGKQGEIKFSYPQVVSNLFLNSFDRYEQPKNLTFHNFFGKAVKIPEDVDESDVGYFRVHTLEYDLAPLSFGVKRVTGSLPINTYPHIERESYSLNTLPPGIQIIGNMVVVNQDKYRGIKLYAKDSTQTILKRITFINYGTKDSPNGRKRAHYFYGQPSTIDIVKKGPLRRIDYDFDLLLKTAD